MEEFKVRKLETRESAYLTSVKLDEVIDAFNGFLDSIIVDNQSGTLRAKGMSIDTATKKDDKIPIPE